MGEGHAEGSAGVDPGAPVLLYDGSCGLCAASIRFVLRHERRHELRFARLGGPFAAAILARGGSTPGFDTVAWYQPAAPGRRERLLTRSAAVLEVLRYVGGRWRILLVAAAVPRPVLDALYRLVARSRRRLWPTTGTCVPPSKENARRFLD